MRRELHDGLGPALAGVGLGLRAAGNLLPGRPAEADALVGQMADEIDGMVDIVRTLAHGLLPPVLEEFGLAAALHELAARHRISGGLDVVVDVDDVAVDVAVDGAVRQAVYGIVAEAVRNAVRHAGATTCTIALRESANGAVLSVIDDGVGLSADHVTGVGLSSMRERAEGIGGVLRIEGGPQGTCVELTMPGVAADRRVS